MHPARFFFSTGLAKARMNAGKQQRVGKEREEARRKNGRGKRGREKDEDEEEEEGEEVEVGSVRKEEVEGGYGEEHIQREIKREKARGAWREGRRRSEELPVRWLTGFIEEKPLYISRART